MADQDPQNILDDSDEAKVERAIALHQMRESLGWKILMLRLAQDSIKAREALVEVDPNNTIEVETLQNIVKRHIWFETSVDEMIGDGMETDLFDELRAEVEEAEVQSFEDREGAEDG